MEEPASAITSAPAVSLPSPSTDADEPLTGAGISEEAGKTAEEPSTGNASPVQTPTAASIVPLQIAVSGNRLVNGLGQAVTLHGVNIDGTEWSCLYGDAFPAKEIEQSIPAMVAWHVNAVRIPLNEDCWLGINGAPTDVVAYHEAIRDFINRLNAVGIYAILDLHWTAPGTILSHLGLGYAGYYEMADADHSPAFWESIASYFIDNHAVLFDLFNEPFGITWGCWRNGCLAPRIFAAAGMQQLVSAVRKTGATQPVIVGGLDQEGSLGAEWLAHRPNDPDNQLVAGAHLYGYHPTESLNANLGVVAEKFPVVISEIGETNCADDEIDSILHWADERSVSYLAWGWYPAECASKIALLSNYSGTPSNYGRGYQELLLKEFPAPKP